jgi:hypothetical protein
VDLEFLWDREGGKEDILLQVKDLYPVCDHVGIVDRLRYVTEQGRHLLRRLEIELVVRKFEPSVLDIAVVVDEVVISRRRLLFTCIDAKQDIVGVVVLPVGVVAVVGGDHRDIVFPGILQEGDVDLLLFFDVMALELDEIVLAEEVQPPFEFLFGLFFAVMQDGLGDIGADTAGRGDQPFMVLSDQFFVDARVFAVQALRYSRGKSA